MLSQNEINYYRVEKAIQYLEKNFLKQPSLAQLAEEVSVSPYHFQRLFTEWAGISPKRFLQFLTIDFLKEKIQEYKNLHDAADATGLSSQSRVYDLFTTLEAVTPQEYKQKGEGIHIQYGFHETLFGLCLIGLTERGVCWLSFVSEERAQALQNMQAHWHRSSFSENTTYTQAIVPKLFSLGKKNVRLLVKGTNFQVKVWNALLHIPQGKLSTYQQIAQSIGQSNALQAVGSAVGANHVAYLIPCHRVIRKDGVLGEYRWTATRKKCILGWEMAKSMHR